MLSVNSSSSSCSRLTARSLALRDIHNVSCPIISVILPVHNGARWIEMCKRALYEQTIFAFDTVDEVCGFGESREVVVEVS